MSVSRSLALRVLLAIGLLACPVLGRAAPGTTPPVIDTNVPDPNEPVEYESSLAPGAAEPGTITAMDRYSWYCFKAHMGMPIEITVDRTSGGLLPNCGLLRGVVNDGVQVVQLGQILAATNSLNPNTVTLEFTPNFTDAVTLWVAGALSTTGDYEVTMTGGEQRPECSPCPTCVPVSSPPDDEAQFKVGAASFMPPDLIIVPLIVDTHEGATFTQMRIEYNSNCLTYVMDSEAPGPDIMNPNSILAIDAAGAVDPDSDRHVQLNVTGTYTGCNRHVLTVQFRFTPGFMLPCRIVWDRTPGGPNSRNHLNYTPGGDGKITPEDITFCDGEISCDPNVEIMGTVEYLSNGSPIIPGVPDATSPPVTVEDCDHMPSTTATSPNADYTLPFGAGPVDVSLCASRPLVVCGTDEDGVISGDDVLLLQNSIPPPGVTDPRLRIAGDVNDDGDVNTSDVLAIQRWVGRKVCQGADACEPSMTQTRNCAGTWRFLLFTDPGDPNAFEVDSADLGSVCNDETVPIEGVVVGDFDRSWPFFRPKSAPAVDLALDIKEWKGDEVVLSLSAKLDAGESLRHVIYSLDYDAAALEYLGMHPSGKGSRWHWFDNPDQAGEAHGIAHIPPHSEALSEPGEVIVFRFRAKTANSMTAVSFSRLRANDIDVVAPDLWLDRGSEESPASVPARYALSATPNPFNPSTRITFAIPENSGAVPVSLRVYSVSGQVVRTLLEGERGPGYHHVVWDGNDRSGNTVSAGVYVLRAEAGTWSTVHKVTLVK